MPMKLKFEERGKFVGSMVFSGKLDERNQDVEEQKSEAINL